MRFAMGEPVQPPEGINVSRGLTMIELLLAVSLLSLIVLAAASWTEIAAHAATGPLKSTRWRLAAQSVLRRIQEDFETGDFELADQPVGSSSPALPLMPRWSFREGALEVKTRDALGNGHKAARPAMHIYTFDRISHRMDLRAQLVGAQSSMRGVVTRPLLEDVESFECSIDKRTLKLKVAIASVNGVTASRMYTTQ